MLHIILAQDQGVGGFEFLKNLSSLSGATILAAIVYLFLAGKIVRRGELDRVIAERDRMESLLWRTLNLSETAADTTKRATDLVGQAVGTQKKDG